jgi:leucyl-tRNA synthetase
MNMQKRSDRYDFQAVEEKWRPYWQQIDLYQTGDDSQKPDYYILDFFPYPSGDGLSVGHCRNYVPTCVDARFHRMCGYNVLHPMGWDAFGLPAENYAIRHNIHPAETSRLFAGTYRRQLQLIECSYDWSREINSTHPDYYKWTQWFFLLLHERGLAYRAPGSQWWCPTCQTILANEQVENGRCWRCDAEVRRKELNQWYFKITDYADRLLADLDQIEWPEHIKAMQRNWIGRSAGAEVIFKAGEWEIPVFTTRPDTLFGVTFLALAPEHPLLADITTPEQETAVAATIAQAQQQTEIDRSALGRAQTGVFTGGYAIHPLTGAEIPIWVADYVLMGYGSGAVMGVPGHDERDFAFAQTYDLPIVRVIRSDGSDDAYSVLRSAYTEEPTPYALRNTEPPTCFTGYGVMVNSGPYTGLASAEGIERIIHDLEAQDCGRRQVSYKLRDWLISRQRYWGAPIPIVHCERCGIVPVPKDELPVMLPPTDDFAPAGDGRSPLARIEAWVNTSCPRCGSPARRETDTMDGFACSSWYFLRFASPRYEDGPFDPSAMRRWLPVDTYVGGAEHAVMHLLYARFWTKVMADAGLVDFEEPFTQLRNQGVLASPLDGRRMSKSRGNVITPDEVVAQHGADALRAYVLFLGPFDADVLWDDAGIRGVTRFIDRYWRLARQMAAAAVEAHDERDGGRRTEDGEGRFSVVGPPSDFERQRHKVIQRVTRDMEQFRYNTAVAALMEYLNELTAVYDSGEYQADWRVAVDTFTRLLAPICPFVTEEVWQTVLGHSGSVHEQAWPTYDEALTVDEVVTVVVQVNGKLRDRIEVPAGLDEVMLRETAVNAPGAQRFIHNKTIRDVIVVPDRLVNIVAV